MQVSRENCQLFPDDESLQERRTNLNKTKLERVSKTIREFETRYFLLNRACLGERHLSQVETFSAVIERGDTVNAVKIDGFVGRLLAAGIVCCFSAVLLNQPLFTLESQSPRHEEVYQGESEEVAQAGRPRGEGGVRQVITPIICTVEQRGHGQQQNEVPVASTTSGSSS